uniref:G_PROTEIN_RECEP_F1_2 domain-containing protein n=1 Tax=Steinernema glaseri TaxID=37863 RepID=A0A1I7Y019_9BILA
MSANDNPGDLSELPGLLNWQFVDISLGGIGVFVNLFMSLLLLSTSSLRKEFLLFALMTVGDTANSLGIGLMGIDRLQIYKETLETGVFKNQTPWNCAMKPFNGVRIFGNMLPPTVQMAMAIERIMCVCFPLFYRNVYSKAEKQIAAACLLLSVAVVAAGFAISWHLGYSTLVRFDCGRKATFSKPYTTFIYFFESIGYILALAGTSLACLRILAMQAKDKRSAHLKKIKCYIAVTLLSTLLVAIPNIESILHAYLIYISNEISRTVVWANATNSTVNVIAFCLLNSKFKQHIKIACTRSVRTVQIASSAVVKPLK